MSAMLADNERYEEWLQTCSLEHLAAEARVHADNLDAQGYTGTAPVVRALLRRVVKAESSGDAA